MGNPTITSQITFLYFYKYEEACKFINEVLGFQVVYNPDWACVWRTVGKSFIGAVDVKKGSIKDITENKSMLVSLTVEDVEKWYEKLKPFELEEMTEIKAIPDIGLKSFFFKGPEGYNFEIQEFTSSKLRDIF